MPSITGNSRGLPFCNLHVKLGCSRVIVRNAVCVRDHFTKLINGVLNFGIYFNDFYPSRTIPGQLTVVEYKLDCRRCIVEGTVNRQDITFNRRRTKNNVQIARHLNFYVECRIVQLNACIRTIYINVIPVAFIFRKSVAFFAIKIYNIRSAICRRTDLRYGIGRVLNFGFGIRSRFFNCFAYPSTVRIGERRIFNHILNLKRAAIEFAADYKHIAFHSRRTQSNVHIVGDLDIIHHDLRAV